MPLSPALLPADADPQPAAARLITARRTNAEIAAELFQSRKTVETHIPEPSTKLSASSRVEIARAIEAANRADRSAP